MEKKHSNIIGFGIFGILMICFIGYAIINTKAAYHETYGNPTVNEEVITDTLDIQSSIDTLKLESTDF